MANVNNPHGLKPLMRNRWGGPVVTEQYAKPSANSTIFMFDVVIAVTGSTAVPANEGGMNCNNVAPLATAGTGQIVGVALDYGATGAITAHRILHNPDAVFECQDDGVGGGIVAANIGKNANISVAQAGSATTKISGMQLGQASIAVTAALDLQIAQLLNTPSNAFGANAIVEVTFGRHFNVCGRTGV